MSIYNAIANSGRDAGAGLNAYARNRYAIQENERQNALYEEDRQYQRSRNALADQRYQEGLEREDQRYTDRMEREDQRWNRQRQEEAAAHAQSVAQAVMQAQTPEQAQAIWNQGQQQAIELQYLDPQEAQPDAWQQLFVDPMQRAREVGSLENDIAAERAQRIAEAQAGIESQRPLTPTEEAQQRKAIAQADKAEADLAQTEREAEAKAQNKDQIKDIALGLLQEQGGEYTLADGVEDVFGTWDGLTPSLQESTIDAESRVDQLVDMLTLENIDKMSGVLSDTDIKILKNAGSRLSNKRISEKAALDELKKIAGVFDRNPGVVASGQVDRGTTNIAGAKVTFK